MTTDWVLAVERAYVADATSPPGWRRPTLPPIHADRPRALAAIGAIASRYLAVGTPRTLGIVVGSRDDLELARLDSEAHATWFAPREIRQALVEHPTTLASALAADIVCVHVPLELRADQLRRGTHVNLLAGGAIAPDLEAAVSRETPDLGRLAAGIVDGRQLDEITVMIAGDATIALHALAGQ